MKLLGAVDAERKQITTGSQDLDLDKRYWNTHLYEDEAPEDHPRAINALREHPASKTGII